MSRRRCTVELANRSFCDATAATGMPFPICPKHALMLYRAIQDDLDAVMAEPHLAMGIVARQFAEERDERRRLQPVDYRVYYLRVDDLIKIGNTTNLPQRLRSYPPNSEFLGSEPGGPVQERCRLEQFAHLLARGREWFRPEPDLLAFIAALHQPPGA